MYNPLVHGIIFRVHPFIRMRLLKSISISMAASTIGLFALFVPGIQLSSGSEPWEAVLFENFGGKSSPDNAVDDGAPSTAAFQYVPGPRPPVFDGFDPRNMAGKFGETGGMIRVADPGDGSRFDFTNGDELTIESWVRLDRLGNGQHAYILGKGRTGNAGSDPDNQNYALRLTGSGSDALVSFLFRDDGSGREGSGDRWHRWTTRSGFAVRSGWHHVAVSYRFGEPSSVQAWIDGRRHTGRWDMGGPTSTPPVCDNDELWIGSGNGDQENNRFFGALDSVALHRRMLPSEVLANRFQWSPATVIHSVDKLPENGVLLEIFEAIPADRSWFFEPPVRPVESHVIPFLALMDLPEKYGHDGIRVDRDGPVLLRFSTAMDLAVGSNSLLLRSLNGARLFVDGELVAENPFISGNADGHGEVGARPDHIPEGLRFPVNDHKDSIAIVRGSGGKKAKSVLTVEAMVGGHRLPLETGEISLTLLDESGREHRLVSPSERVWLHDDPGWEAAVQAVEGQFEDYHRRERQRLQAEKADEMRDRHQRIAASISGAVKAHPPEVRNWNRVRTPVDRFIQARLEKKGIQPLPMIDDPAFLRRLSLDTVGVPPTPDEIRDFFEWDPASRRDRAIRYYIQHDGWADHWVSYWQDVLAENPAILKPTLNNTGPFRYWIHESFADNKPLDQFIRELVRMQGSVYGGGPAGFGLATQNDVPMADKAQVLTQAFMARNLACARCHDAPFHDFYQQDLFGLAAMLEGKPIEVPASSSLPAERGQSHSSMVDVTLKPGESVRPHWAFASVTAHSPEDYDSLSKVALRDEVARLMTEDNALEIARVFVNRMWKRYLGRGLVEPVDDWEDSKPSHPELLDWMAVWFVEHGFDVRELARLILSSDAYQREVATDVPEVDPYAVEIFPFDGVLRRRMSAEQIVDSALAVVGRPMETERLTLDNDGRRLPGVFLNLGFPSRAWEFTGLSNDRDRPALSMPRIQEIVDFLKYFGWRESRQDPLTDRDQQPGIMQPANIANSNFINSRVVILTGDSAITEMALEEVPLGEFVDQLYLRLLTRLPTEAERQMTFSLLAEGYEERVVSAAKPREATRFDPASLLSWSNHLNAKATEIKLLVEERALEGDPPTTRLHSEWREALEDLIWAILNSPEFIFIP